MDIGTLIAALAFSGSALGYTIKVAQDYVVLKTKHAQLEADVSDNGERIAQFDVLKVRHDQLEREVSDNSERISMFPVWHSRQAQLEKDVEESCNKITKLEHESINSISTMTYLRETMARQEVLQADVLKKLEVLLEMRHTLNNVAEVCQHSVLRPEIDRRFEDEARQRKDAISNLDRSGRRSDG